MHPERDGSSFVVGAALAPWLPFGVGIDEQRRLSALDRSLTGERENLAAARLLDDVDTGADSPKPASIGREVSIKDVLGRSRYFGMGVWTPWPPDIAEPS